MYITASPAPIAEHAKIKSCPVMFIIINPPYTVLFCFHLLVHICHSSRDYRSLWSVDCNASAFRKTTGIKCEGMITKRKEAQQEENDQII